MSINYPATGIGMRYPYPAPQGVDTRLRAQDSWQPGDGMDGGLTINRALAKGAARYPGGFTLDLGPIDWGVATPIQVASDNVRIVGHGVGGSQLSALPGLGANPILNVLAPGPAGVFRQGFALEDVTVQGNNLAGAGGVQLTSTYHAFLKNVQVLQVPGVGIFFTGSGAARGAYTTCVDCTLTNGGAGTAYMTEYAENNTVIGGLVAYYDQPGGVGAKFQDGVNQILGTVFDECDTGVWLYYCNGSQIIGAQFTRGLTQFMELEGATRSICKDLYFDQFVGVAAGQHMLTLTSSCVDNLFEGCVANTATGWPGFVNDNSNAVAANRFVNCQTQGLQVLLNASASRMTGCPGFNPWGHNMPQPAVPASGTALTNTYNVDATVFVEGGTVTAVAIGGTATGATGGPFRVPYGQSITLTYSVAPTWQWFGD